MPHENESTNAVVRRHDKEIASHSDKLTHVDERLVALENRIENVSKVNLVLAQLCDELGYNVRTLADFAGMPEALLVNPGGPFFEPDDVG